MDVRTLSALPGADLVLKGIGDLESGTDSIEALLVQIGGPKLRSLGLAVQADPSTTPPEQPPPPDADSAHPRYNALIRRLVSSERALACVSP